MSYEIIPPHLAIKSMRDNGYRNPAYALAELIDNSIQARVNDNSLVVELLCAEKKINSRSNEVSRIHQIAVLDNGKGMGKEILRQSLQFGNGTNLEPENQKSIGKFGMGLPASSISQCRKVEIWSWQNGIESSNYTYLDIDEVMSKRMLEVPNVEKKLIPEIYKIMGSNIGKTGTLVVWSNLDRIFWKTSEAIIRNTEFYVGRLYRRFLNKKKVKIRMIGFDVDNPNPINPKIVNHEYAMPNDPIYLMKETSCPSPWNKDSMFEGFTENFEIPISVQFRGKKHTITLRFTVAKKLARPGVNPGHLPHGKHAARNLGISIVRADRELELDQSWVNPSDARDRWWGAEIEFSPELDELLGVTNNKQHARVISELADLDIESQKEDGVTLTELKKQLHDMEDPRELLIELAARIDRNLKDMRNFLKLQTGKPVVDPPAADEEDDVSPESIGTEVTNKRIKEGNKTQNDRIGEEMSPVEKIEELKKTLTDDGLPLNEAEALSARIINSGLKYVFQIADLDTSAFFSVKIRAGAIIITLNHNHPAYKHLYEILDESTNEQDEEVLKRRLHNARDGLKLLLEAWARTEDEERGKPHTLPDMRTLWGMTAKQFLDKE